MADLSAMLWGKESGLVVAALAALSALGALNGWVFLQAEVPLVLAERGIFPAFFARVNAAGMPVGGHLLGCGLSLCLLALNLSSGLIAIYNFVILLAMVATLVLYLTAAVALGVLVRRGVDRGPLISAAALVGFLFSLWTLYGAGAKATGWGMALLASGVPVYFLMRWRAGSSPAAATSPAGPRESAS
jgi:APA family basic amino acid/polyamine antiporter